MEEIEVKILEIDKDKVIRKLLEFGAEKVFDGPMNSVYLDSADKLRNSDKMLRIRQKGDKCIVTLKVKKEDSEAKVNDEYETEVKDFEEARKIFHNLGFKEFATDFRKRISYKIKNSLVEINIYEDIPPFLEVEAPNKDELKEIVKLMGFSLDQTKTWTGKEVLDFYKGRAE